MKRVNKQLTVCGGRASACPRQAAHSGAWTAARPQARPASTMRARDGPVRTAAGLSCAGNLSAAKPFSHCGLTVRPGVGTSNAAQHSPGVHTVVTSPSRRASSFDLI